MRKGLIESRVGSQVFREEFREGVVLSEGRVVAAEVIVSAPPLVEGVSNIVLAAIQGVDVIILNKLDLRDYRMVEEVAGIRKVLPIPFLVNLEPIKEVESGRRVTEENLEVVGRYFDGVVITGNPYTLVDNKAVAEATQLARNKLNNLLILSGRMHSCGVAEESRERLVTTRVAKEFLERGADGVVIPTPSTVSGITIEKAVEICEHVHSMGGVVMCCLDNSAEGSGEEAITQLALYSKMCGADIHHIGDAGYSGSIAPPENIRRFAETIKGRRHVYRRQASLVVDVFR